MPFSSEDAPAVGMVEMARLAMRRWKGFSKLEKALTVVCAVMAAAMVGMIAGQLIARPLIDWDAATAIIAFVAVIVAVIGYFDNRKSQRLEHRAYLAIRVKDISFLPDAKPMIVVTIPNYGRTPAHNAETIAAFVVGDNDWKWDPAYSLTEVDINQSGVEVSLATIHPGDDEFNDMTMFGHFVLSATDYAAINTSEKFIYFRACVTYDDVFGDRHSTSVSYRIDNRATVHGPWNIAT